MVVLEHFMINQLKLEHLQLTFLKLTESNQHYILGFAEGLKFAQVKENPPLKTPGSSTNSATVFYTRSCGRENCS